LTSFPETLALTELGREQVLSVEDWAEIRRLRRSEGMAISQIARVLGISRNTVKAALASDGPPRYQRPPAGSVADGFEPKVRELLQAYPRMPATVIAQQVPAQVVCVPGLCAFNRGRPSCADPALDTPTPTAPSRARRNGGHRSQGAGRQSRPRAHKRLRRTDHRCP